MAEVEIIFKEVGADDVIAASKEVTKKVSDLKRLAAVPIELQFTKDRIGAGFETFAKQVEAARKQVQELKNLGKSSGSSNSPDWLVDKSAVKMAADSLSHMGIEYEKVSSRMKAPLGASKSFRDLGVDINALKREARGLGTIGEEMEKNTNKTKNLGVQLGFLGRLLVAMGVRKFVHDMKDMIDAYTNFENKLKVVVDGHVALKIATQDLIKISNDSRTGLEESGILFSRVTQATKALGKSQSEVTQFTSTMNKAIQVSGATSNEAKNAIIQLSQGMALGTLRGQDLKSVLEFLPYVSQLIANKMGVAVGSLKQLGSQGKITTDIVFKAMIESTGDVEKKFAKLTPTISQVWEVLKNKYLVALGDSAAVTRYVAISLQYVADNFDRVLKAITSLAAGITTLWIASSVRSFVMFLGSNPTLLLVGGILAAIAAVVTFGDKMSDTGKVVDQFGNKVDVLKKHMDAFNMKDAIIGTAKSDMKDFADTVAKVLGMITGKGWTISLSILGWDEVYDRLAKIIDALRIISRPDKLAEAFAAKLRGNPEDKKVVEDYLKFETKMQDAVAMQKRIAVGQGKDASRQKMIDTEARWNQQMSEVTNASKVTPPAAKGKKEGGKTFEEIISDATFRADVADDNSLSRRVETKLRAELEKLKPSIKKWAIDLNEEIRKAQETYQSEQSNRDPNAQDHLTGTMDKLRGKYGKGKVEQELQLRERVIAAEQEKDIQALILQINKDIVKAQAEYIEKQKVKLDRELEVKAAHIATLKAQKEQAAKANTEFRQSTAEELDPTIATNRKIADLQRFGDMMKDQPGWVALTNQRVKELKDSMTDVGKAGKIFEDQMHSVFGPGGSMVQGIGDAIAGAKNLGQALKEVINSVVKQALSALVQLPLNIAASALESALKAGPMGQGPSLASGALTNSALSFGKAAPLATTDAGIAIPDGFASGGYTGNYGTDTPAGIVHGQEYVVNADATKKYRPMLEAMNKGGTMNGGGSTPTVTVHNYAGVQVETSISQGEIQLMITRGIKAQTGPVVAAHINDPSSPVSRSINKNIDAGRRR